MSQPNWWKTACAVCVLCAATAIALPAQTFTTLYSFCSQSDCTDGTGPTAGLIQATTGDLYGTAADGGASGDGTVFKISPSGTLTVLYSFCPENNCADGAFPFGGVLQDTNGNYYGTAGLGGANMCSGGGCGTIFRMTASGALTTLHSFDGTDGDDPRGLVEGTNGKLYGTTGAGGAKGNGGTVFEITPTGTLTTLHSFCEREPCTDGLSPYSGLVEADNGDFYGTTSAGGIGNGCQNTPPQGCGTVFKITAGGRLTTLHSFCAQSGCPDGDGPLGGLVQANDGNLYGTTLAGGANSCLSGTTDYGCGTIFRITPSGGFATIYSFCSQAGCTDGSDPEAALVQGTDGNLYGTTDIRGANMSGTLFKITLNGTLTTLYTFCSQSGCADGAQPVASLVEDTNGEFYGTTILGGANGYGTVFSLSVGLAPFVETLPGSGRVGAGVGILGTNLTGATSVTFNGTAATFTVISSSLITATVPEGATTGKVQVVTPGGTLSSNVPFRVRQ